jgi:hypothetical protein
MAVSKTSSSIPAANKKNKTKRPVSELEQAYLSYFHFQTQTLGRDPFEQVSLYDYSIPVTSGASTETN